MRRTVNNMPKYAEAYRFIVVSDVDNDLWFYGAYETEARAREVARQIEAEVIENIPDIDDRLADERLQQICNSKERIYRNTKRGTATANNLLLDLAYLNKMLTTD